MSGWSACTCMNLSMFSCPSWFRDSSCGVPLEYLVSVLTSSQALVGPVEVGRGDQEQVQWDLEVSTTVSAVAPVGDHEARWHGGRRVVILHQRGAAAAPAEGPGGL